MDYKISLIGPVRGRPQRLLKMWQSAYNLAKQKDSLELCLYIDDDDAPTKATAFYMAGEWNYQVKPHIGFKRPQAQMINKCYEISDGQIIQFIADDLVFIKEGWDDIIRAEFDKVNDKAIMVFSPDGFQTDFGTHVALHRNIIKVLGYAANPNLIGVEWADTWWNDIMGAIGRKVQVEQLYEHEHPSAGKAAMDSTYLAHLNRAAQDACGSQYYAMTKQRQDDLEKIKQYIEYFNNEKN